ncbi:SusC/RagA family TonB-linked outer membrane protein [Pedobacter sp. MW01-1-1]|uniref:SusC/RagA family TonB-linked outer membrane protein n=1 Tax=Pedobacter sp. MW01-1-1 TaxID=3383027 RepID=UPI003FF10FB5
MKQFCIKISVLAGICLLAINVAFAQNITVKGTVIDGGDQTSLPSVSITIKGTQNGTQTDVNGKYSINVPSNATLVFSYLGYAKQEVQVNNRTTINISLQSENQQLEQVVVVGYGTQKVKDLTGSIASVKGDQLAKQPVQTATQALQGKVAGVQVISSGEPNANPTVRLRGTGSTLGGANPLYVVDGVITDDIRNINNADIVSLEVLKDASATAIYGMRAANGVLIITTKKGKKGDTVFSYDGVVGFSQATNLVDMAGENQYAGYLNEANKYYGSGTNLIDPNLLKGANTDWYDAILRNGFQQNQNISLSGGNDNIIYFLSAGYLTNNGLQLGNSYNRFTLRSNNDYILSKKLKLTSVVSYARGDADGANLGSFGNAYRAAPYVPSKVGDLYGNTSLAGNVANPLLDIDKNYNQTIGNRIQGNFALEYKPIEGLTLRSSMGIDLDFTKSTAYGYKYLNDGSTFITPAGNQSRPNSTLKSTKNDASRWIWDNTATYSKTFGKHSFTVLGGVTAEKYKFNSLVGSALDVPENQDQWYLNAGTSSTQTVSNTGDKYARNSYLGRINYGYDNRYLITASFRADGTSKFDSDNRWGYFPSVGVAWNITNEAFMDNQKVFSNLKLRGSFGKVGNDNIASSLYYSIAQRNLPYYYDGSATQGIALGNINDKNLKWEITDEWDAGLDFGLLNNRLSGTFDYYSKKTSNALIYIPLPGILGDPDKQYLTNASTITNKGVEFSLNWEDKIGENWSYSIGGNVAHNKNNVEKLNGGQPLIGDNVGNYAITKTDNGMPIASFFLLEKIGIFQNQAEIDASAQKDARAGDIMYRDISGPNNVPDGVIDQYDRSYFGSYQPKVTYGLNGSLTYKSFDFSFGFYGTAGGKIYNGKKAARGTSQLTDNIEADVARNRWTPNNPSNSVPRATLGALPASTYFLESGSFLRLNNLTLGYSLPNTVLNKLGVTKVRFYLTSQNLFTITSYTGFTPEIQAAAGEKTNLNQGVDTNTYPSSRTFAFGVNVGF